MHKVKAMVKSCLVCNSIQYEPPTKCRLVIDLKKVFRRFITYGRKSFQVFPSGLKNERPIHCQSIMHANFVPP